MGVAAGPWFLDNNLRFTVNTHDAATGAATDADSVPTYRVYEAALDTPILTGNMAKLDDTNTVGFYVAAFELSEGNGFYNGFVGTIYVSKTVDSVTTTESLNFKISSDTGAILDGFQSSIEQIINSTSQLLALVLQTSTAGSTGNDDTHIQIDNSPGWGDDDLNELLISITVDGAPHTRWITDFASGLATLHEALPVAIEENDPYTIFAIRRDVSGGGGASAEDVWAYGTRTLTALDEDGTTIDIDGVVRSAVGLASSNLDTQLGNLPTNAELATALSTADDAVLAQIALVKTKTDSLTFTVAGQVDANIESVNGTTVNGAGTEGDPWRP